MANARRALRKWRRSSSKPIAASRADFNWPNAALYSARNEFVAALQLIAQANDMQQSTRIYSHGLSAGLAALKEGGQFVRAGAAVEGTDLARLISGHKTPLLKNTPVAELTPTAAAQRYHTYAQEQLAAAAAQEMTGSMALFGLGKLAMTTPAGKSQQLEPTAEAMAHLPGLADGRPAQLAPPTSWP